MGQDTSYLLIVDLANGCREVVAVPKKFLSSFQIALNMHSCYYFEINEQLAMSLLERSNGIGAGCYTLEGQDDALRASYEAAAGERLDMLCREMGMAWASTPKQLSQNVLVSS